MRTVGDLIDALERFDRDAPVRLMVHPGTLLGADRVQEVAGRVTVRALIGERKQDDA